MSVKCHNCGNWVDGTYSGTVGNVSFSGLCGACVDRLQRNADAQEAAEAQTRAIREAAERQAQAQLQAAQIAAKAEIEAARIAAEEEQKEREEAIRVKSIEDLKTALKRVVAYNEVAFNERLQGWVLKTELIAEQNAARESIAKAAGVPKGFFSSKESKVVYKGRTPSYSMAVWDVKAQCWKFNVADAFLFENQSCFVCNDLSDLAPWKSLCEGREEAIGAINWEEWSLFGNKKQVIFRQSDLDDAFPAKDRNCIDYDESKRMILAHYYGKDSRKVPVDYVEHYFVINRR